MEVDDEENSHDVVIQQIREKNRRQASERRKEQMLNLFAIKRTLTNEKESSKLEISPEKVVESAKQLKKKKKVEILKYLSNAFGCGDQFIKIFLSVDGALYALTSCLTGKEENLQIEAANCLINLSSGNHKSTFKCVKASSVYLIAFLDSGNIILQEKCVWTLGNFAADCHHCSEVLRLQGFVRTARKLLRADNLQLRCTTYFAFARYMSTRKQIDDDLLDRELLELFLQPFISPELHLETTREAAAIIFYYTLSGKYDLNLIAAGVIEKSVFVLTKIAQSQNIDAVAIVTLLLRILSNLVAADEAVVIRLISHTEIGIVIKFLLTSQYNHLIKESLWLLSNVCGYIEGIEIMQLNGLLQRVVELCEFIGDIYAQAFICLCNVASLSAVCCNQLVTECNILYKLERLLQRRDAETNHCVLLLTLMLVSNCTLSRDQFISTFTNYISRIQSLICSNDIKVQSLVDKILQKYRCSA